MLHSIADDLSVAEQPLRYFGVGLTTRMTIIRLMDGALVVHSPIRLTGELRSTAASARRARFIIAPNRFHHLFVPDWGSNHILTRKRLARQDLTPSARRSEVHRNYRR